MRLIPQLQQLGIKIGVATSVRKQYWEASRIFPARQGSPLDLNALDTVIFLLLGFDILGIFG